MGSILDSYAKIPVEEFSGAEALRESSDIEPPWGLVSDNVEYKPGAVETRRGVYAAGAVSGIPKFALNRVSGTNSYVYAKDGLLFSRIVNNGSASTHGLISTATGSRMAEYGDRLFFDGSQVVVWDDTALSSAVAMPRTYDSSEVSMTASVTAGGGGTPGLHYAALLLETARGFITLPTPWIYNNFVPGGQQIAKTGFSFVLTSSNATVTLTWNRTAGNWAPFVKAYLLLTTAANPNRYMLTGQSVALSGSSSAIFSGVNIPDGRLAAQVDASFHESLLVQDFGTGLPDPPTLREQFPKNCSGVMATQQRMGYFAGGGVFFSEPGLPETVTRDRHFVRLPHGETPLAGFMLQGTIFLTGPEFTYAYVDTGGYPATWPIPRIVDDSIGASHPNGVATDESGIAFVAHYNGLYVIDGSAYSRRPLSYHQTELWKQISWPTTTDPNPVFSVADMPGERMVFVLAKVAGTPTVLMWDYSNGLNSEAAKFSRWTFGSRVPSHLLRVLNFGDAKQTAVAQQLWMTANDGGGQIILKRKPYGSSPPYTDEFGGGNAAPAGKYKTAYLGIEPGSGVRGFRAVRIAASGAGTLGLKAYALDDLRNKVMNSVPLAASPGRVYDRLFDLRSEACAIEFSNSAAAGDHFQVSELALFADNYAARRPGVAKP